jgi:hypothetical protein
VKSLFDVPFHFEAAFHFTFSLCKAFYGVGCGYDVFLVDKASCSVDACPILRYHLEFDIADQAIWVFVNVLHLELLRVIVLMKFQM